MKLRKKQRVSPLMKTLIITEAAAVLLLFALVAYKSNTGGIDSLFEKTPPDVILDAGHGGFDTGAISGNIQEKDINLAIVKEIGNVLEENGYSVEYVRDSDEVDWADNERDDLRYRVKTANESNAKLFVSVHINSEETDQGSYGYEVWGKLKKEHVFALAKNILDSVSSLGYSQDRGMKDQDTKPLYILEHSEIPAVLFEAGFIGNAQDMEHLKEGKARKLFSDKTAQGIIKTLKDMEKAEKEKT